MACGHIPKAIDGELSEPSLIPVWVDDKEDELDVYYVSPRWYVPDEVFDFIAEKNWGKNGEYWKQNSRYAEACEAYDGYCQWFASGKNRQGAS